MVYVPDNSRLYPLYQKVNEGETVLFTCQSSFLVKWMFRNTLPLRNSLLSQPEDNLYQIKITNAQQWHAGQYTCYGRTLETNLLFKQWAILVVLPKNSSGRFITNITTILQALQLILHYFNFTGSHVQVTEPCYP